MPPPVVNLRDPAFDADRFAEIERLRALHWHAVTGDGAPVFFAQEDVRELLRCERFRFAFNEIDETRSPYLAKAIRHELLNMHGDAHARLSRLVKHALRDRVVEGLAARIEEVVVGLLADLPEGEVEFCAAFANPLPARVLGPMFGLPYEATEGLNDWIRIGGRKVDALQSGVDIGVVEDANRNMHGWLRGLIEARRTTPGDDLFSELMAAEIGGDRLSDDEVVYLAAELASAGVDTTRAQLPLILHALLTHPAEMARLRAEPGLALRAVDEGMRFTPLPWALPHAAVATFDYKGIAFAPGDVAFALVPAANRDPAVVDRPDEFDIARPRARHFAFGAGMHACPGAQLARMEMAAALQGLIGAFGRIELLAAEWTPGQTGRTLERLRVTLWRA